MASSFSEVTKAYHPVLSPEIQSREIVINPTETDARSILPAIGCTAMLCNVAKPEVLVANPPHNGLPISSSHGFAR